MISVGWQGSRAFSWASILKTHECLRYGRVQVVLPHVASQAMQQATRWRLYCYTPCVHRVSHSLHPPRQGPAGTVITDNGCHSITWLCCQQQFAVFAKSLPRTCSMLPHSVPVSKRPGPAGMQCSSMVASTTRAKPAGSPIGLQSQCDTYQLSLSGQQCAQRMPLAAGENMSPNLFPLPPPPGARVACVFIRVCELGFRVCKDLLLQLYNPRPQAPGNEGLSRLHALIHPLTP